MAVLDHHAARAEGGGGAQDGADVLRVGDLVQHQDHSLGGPGDVLDIDGLGRRGQERDALVDRPGRQLAVDLARIERLGLGAPIGGQGAARRQQQALQPLALRIGQSRFHRMAAPDPFQAGLRLRLGSAVEPPGFAFAAVVASDGSGHYKTRSRFWAEVASVLGLRPDRTKSAGGGLGSSPSRVGGMSRAAKGADCKSAGVRLRRFESCFPHHAPPGLGCCPRSSSNGEIRRRGYSTMVVQQPSKLRMPVRSRLPAPDLMTRCPVKVNDGQGKV